MSFESQWIARILGCPSPTPPALYPRIITDSRKVQIGDLFVALKGDQFDGHDFLEDAIQKGAAGVLVSKDRTLKPTSPCHIYAVEDPLVSFRELARAWRTRFSIPILAVIGSVGKTTTKELTAAILTGRDPNILKTQASQNGYIGIPMTLLELRESAWVAVIEIGIDEIGAMQSHLQVVQPTHTLLTAIAPEHLEKLKNLETVAREELLGVSETLRRGGMAIINLDDPEIRKWVQNNRPGNHVIGVNLDAPPAGKFQNLMGTLTPTTLELEGMGLKNSVPLPLPGRHNALNLLLSVAAARALDLTEKEIAEGLASFRPAKGRTEIYDLKTGTRVLCDYYNANPGSMRAALGLLAELAETRPTSRTRWACLADMLELGSDEEALHRELADPILHYHLDHVLLFGNRMKALEAELKQRHFKGKVHHFSQKTDLASFLKKHLRPEDIVLLKGSRGMAMEEVWELLMKELK